MGEIADMMLDGTMCCQCGEFIDTDNGFPTLCGGCEREQRDEVSHKPGSHFANQCSACGRVFKTANALDQHFLALHDARSSYAKVRS